MFLWLLAPPRDLWLRLSMNRRILFLALLVISLTSTLHAQAKFAIYGTGGGEKTGIVNQSGWNTAATFGFYYGIYHVGPLDLSADARADLSSDIKSGLLGPRLAFHLPIIAVKPYAEILVGGSTYPNTPSGLSISSKIVGRVVGGVDTAIFPNVDWRMIDYSYGLNSANHQQTISTGLVLRF
jgi:hypothetical protein